MDVDSVEPGVDFGASIEQAVAASDVLVALIGPAWTTIAATLGRPRIADPEDWVVREIAATLERGIRVVPVLVDGARMPGERDLPPSLAPLARRNAVHLRHESFAATVEHLLGALDRALGRAAAPAEPVAEPPLAPDGRCRRPIHLLRHRRPDLAGREELLDAMHARLTAPGPTLRQLVLHGLGGVGKTSVMREYAHRHAAYNLVFEVGAKTPTPPRSPRPSRPRATATCS